MRAVFGRWELLLRIGDNERTTRCLALAKRTCATAVETVGSTDVTTLASGSTVTTSL